MTIRSASAIAKPWVKFLLPKDIWSVGAALLVGYIAVIDKPFSANNVSFRVTDIQPVDLVAPSTTRSATDVVMWRLVVMNKGNQQIAVHRMIPAIVDRGDPGLYHKLIIDDDWAKRNPTVLIDGGKTTIVDLRVTLQRADVAASRLDPSPDALKVGAEDKLKAVLCFATVASNGVPRNFIQQVGWIYMKDGRFHHAVTIADEIPVDEPDGRTCAATAT